MKTKFFRFATRMSVVLVMMSTLSACDESDEFQDDATLTPLPQHEMGYVVNQGSMYSGIAGSLDAMNLTNGDYAHSIFEKTNEQSLGDSPQSGVAYGSRLYIAVFGSNLVWAIDRDTWQIAAQITTTAPEAICAADGAVYVTNNDGYVTRIDTTTLQANARLAVGPNPAHLTAADGHLYISISDGYNYDGGYANGCRVAKVRLSDFTKVGDIMVGVNPGPIVADGAGRVFVVARGNYADILPQVYQIQPDGTATVLCEGSDVAVAGENLYVMNQVTDWSVVPAVNRVSYTIYDTQSGKVKQENFIPTDQQPVAPIRLIAHPTNGEIYVTSNASLTDYTSPGYVYRYAADGTFIARYDAGIAPCDIFF